jgi:hydrogenase-1 operon protein HyaF
MSGLDEIRVVIDEGNGMRENVHAILHEIEALLGRLLETGEASAIDIRSLPLLPGDYESLDSALGSGEISAEFHGDSGPTVVMETGIPGVWWVSHFALDEELQAEFIEITLVPEILLSQEEDIREGLEDLRQRLAAADNH